MIACDVHAQQQGDSQFVNIYSDQQVREEAWRTQRLKRSDSSSKKENISLNVNNEKISPK